MSDAWKTEAIIDTDDPRIEVLDITGQSVSRGIVTLREKSFGEATCDGLLVGDRLYIDGRAIYCDDPLTVPQVYKR